MTDPHSASASDRPPLAPSPFKGRTGLRRVLNACRYTAQGIGAAYRHEAAFRQEVWAAVVLVPLACVVQVSPAERALMIASVIGVLIVELLNSAIEAIVDRVSLEHHPLAGRAKDAGSAAVALAIVIVIAVWAICLWP